MGIYKLGLNEKSQFSHKTTIKAPRELESTRNITEREVTGEKNL